MLVASRSRIAAEITHRGDIHVVHVPASPRTLNRVEGRLARHVPLPQLHADLTMILSAPVFSEGAGAIVVEVAGQNYQTLFQLGSIHRLPSRSILRSENGSHRLDILLIRGFQEHIDGKLRRSGSGQRSVVADRLGPARASGEKYQTGNSSKGHDRILHGDSAAT